MRKQLILIGIVVLAAAGVGYYFELERGLLAALFGGCITVINVLLLYWHQRRAERVARADAGMNLRILVSCAIQRFFATAMLFAFGLGILQLPPLPLFGGFGVALVAQYVGDPNFRTLRT